MYWLQSEIKNNIYPFFSSASTKVEKSSRAYSILADISFPERFSGKNSVSVVMNSMIACSESALDLKGILTSIGNGMKYGDDKSYKRLMQRFETTQQSLREIRTAAILYRQSGEYPTRDKIEQYLTTNLNYDGYGNGWGYTPEGKITANENFNDITNFIPELFTGAKSGILGFVGDFIGGIGGAAHIFGNKQKQKGIIEKTDWGGFLDTAAKSSGFNPNSLIYSLGKEVGQISTGVGMTNLITAIATGNNLINPNSKDMFKKGAVMTFVYAGVYASQSFATAYRTTEKYLAQNNTRLTEEQKLKNASTAAGFHAATTFSTTLTTGITFGGLQTLGIPEFYGPAKLIVNTAVHTLGGFGHQIIDHYSGVRKEFDGPKGMAAALMAAAATGIAMVGDEQGLVSGYSSSTTPTSAVIQQTVKSESNATVRTSVVSNLVDNPVTGNMIDDATGGSHSYTLPVLEKIIDGVRTGASRTLYYKAFNMNDDWKEYDR